MEQSAETSRKLRADAVRNRQRVLAAAKAVFSAGRADASLEAVARRAGVGIGTLYRHFPTREALYTAVYQHEVQQLWELAERLKEAASPVQALRRGLRAFVEFIATKKGMSAASALAVTGFSELHTDSSARLEKAARILLERAVAAGKCAAALLAKFFTTMKCGRQRRPKHQIICGCRRASHGPSFASEH